MASGPGERVRAVALALFCGLSGSSFAADIADIANLSGPDREKILIEGARQEGKVTIYSAMIDDQALRPITDAFNRKYPFVKAEYWRSESRDLVNKALAEARGRNVVGDVIEGGGIAPTMQRAGILQSFKTPALEIYDKDLRDPKGFWAATRVSYFGVGYNTRQISPADAPKTYDDLLDPKMRGKLCWSSDGETGSALMFITFMRMVRGDGPAEDYLRRLSDQNVINYAASSREVVNKVMQGECGAALNIFLHHPIISAQKGASVASQPMEPVLSNASIVTLPKLAPHPHAAMLLIDFLLSREAQEVLEKADYIPAHPDVPPQPGLASIIPKTAHLTSRFLSEDYMFTARTQSLALQRKYFQPK